MSSSHKYCLQAASNFLGDVLFFLAMMKTSPLVVAVGTSLTLPLAVIGDFLIHQSASALALVGCVIVLASFGVLGLASSKDERNMPVRKTIQEDSGSTHGTEDEEFELRPALHTSE